MNKFLLANIEDVLDVTGRGIILAPGFNVSDYKFEGDYEVEIVSPNNQSKKCKAVFTVPFQSPPPKVRKYWCHLSGITKSEIAVGSELWLCELETDIRLHT